MRVEPLSASWEERWETFVRAHPAGLFYSTLAYRDLIAELLDAEPHYLVASEGDEVRGVFPAMSTEGPHGVVLNSLPYYGSNGGPLAYDQEAEERLVAACDERVANTSAATVIENPFLERMAPTPVHRIEDERIVQFTELSPRDADGVNLLARVDGSARRNVRKAQREGIEVAVDNSALGRLYELHEENITAIGGLPKSERFFELVERRLRADMDYQLWVARLGGTVVAALLTFSCSRTIEYYTPAIDHEARPLQPLAAILAAALPSAARRGSEIWNWGGTWLSQKSLYRFKRKWAASERRYRYFTQINEPSLLRESPEQLRTEYPGFFIAPYSALEWAEATA